MNDVKAGDVIFFSEHGATRREIITGRLENMIWTRVLNSDGSVGSIIGPHEIQDLVTFGFKKEASND